MKMCRFLARLGLRRGRRPESSAGCRCVGGLQARRELGCAAGEGYFGFAMAAVYQVGGKQRIAGIETSRKMEGDRIRGREAGGLTRGGRRREEIDEVNSECGRAYVNSFAFSQESNYVPLTHFLLI
ncbi:hypothetical protein LXL04_033310 [Taraxacum kok-saghyz]